MVIPFLNSARNKDSKQGERQVSNNQITSLSALSIKDFKGNHIILISILIRLRVLIMLNIVVVGLLLLRHLQSF